LRTRRPRYSVYKKNGRNFWMRCLIHEGEEIIRKRRISMSCYRFDLQRKYSLYLHGLLGPSSAKRIEDHLVNCQTCLVRLEKMKSIEKLIQDLPRVSPAKDVWPSIKLGLSQNLPLQRLAPVWKKIAVVAIFGLISGLFGAAAYVKVAGHENFLEASIHPGEFKPVSISHMAQTVEPHVVTEGYVTESEPFRSVCNLRSH
jgi:hypothetical protein